MLGINQPYLSLLIKKKRKPSLSLAFGIERLTGGEIPAKSWIEKGSQ